MIYGVSDGVNICKSCNREYLAHYEKYPENDIKHSIGCPYCNATVGYAEGTDDVSTFEYTEEQTYTPTCPDCGSIMNIQVNSNTHEFFWSCSRSPRQHRTRNYYGKRKLNEID
ncbi:hypothetical protein [Eubacterium sp. MSJ-33]|uniref:hypothetical protein n=1 Tax=Eubacterium sp. MSJ-33 TaxID=2841528 RepID=UPI001C76EFA4|nr:hypothetical protein [Eubacterium sp. MSJ-33]QWT51934.1 hypothetical protein KP625_07330 [Eubacterium sp. MSJ-33]